jgi:hypothetical protein
MMNRRGAEIAEKIGQILYRAGACGDDFRCVDLPVTSLLKGLDFSANSAFLR